MGLAPICSIATAAVKATLFGREDVYRDEKPLPARSGR